MSLSPDTFRPGDKVLAYHGPLVYEAKVLKYHETGKSFVELGEGRSESMDVNKIPAFLLDGNAYFLHYKGWNPKWDEWVSSERILEFNDDNLGLSRELRHARKKAIDRLDPGSDRRPPSSEPKSKRGKKPASASNSRLPSSQPPEASKSAVRKRPKAEKSPYEIMLPLTARIKSVLVDDWELVTKDRKLVDLDTVTPVAQILQKYHSWKQQYCEPDDLRVLEEAVEGVQLFFDKSLSLDLLYKFERLQFSDLLARDAATRPSDVYGLEHFLRLLSTIPARVAQTGMDAVSLNVLMGQVREMLEYLDDNLVSFGSSYMNASPQYDRMARA